MDKYGLIGKNLDYSFSKDFFHEKFSEENIDALYENFSIDSISEVEEVFQQEPYLRGLNVTIPYKTAIMGFLDEVEREAKKIGAVNVVQFKDGKRIGHNTDCFGFMKALFPLLEKQHQQALILGTGGASKAVAHGLKSLGIEYTKVSRKPTSIQYSYEDLNDEIIAGNHLIINCTPLGAKPNIKDSPNIPYNGLTKRHLLFDLIYNPKVTQFLANGKIRGCSICNGQKMLEFQAERAWNIWGE